MKIAFAVFVGWAAATIGAAAAEDAQAQFKRGQVLLTRHCASCHAVERTGASARPEAVPLRLLGARYPIDALEEALGEGIITGHTDMPEYRFSAEDVGAILVYLKSIQER